MSEAASKFPTAWCNVCEPHTELPAGEILDHLRLMHPDDYGDGPECWPDGNLVIVDMDPEPEDFGEREGE